MAEVNTTQIRDALAWATEDKNAAADTTGNPWEWFWQSIQGDFNENRSTGQIVLDAAISMIPLVDQLCDVRDLVANCKKLREDTTDKWAWVALALTLVGLFPFLGSLVKGVLKVFFAFIRRVGGNAIAGAVDNAMTWVITLLRREAFQRYLRAHHIDEVFHWLSTEVNVIRRKTKVVELLKAFDNAIRTFELLVRKVQNIPVIGSKAQSAFEQVQWVRSRARQGFSDVSDTIDALFEAVIVRLDKEALKSRHGIVNANNIHYRGALPESTAVAMMRSPRPCPNWLTAGTVLPWPAADFGLMKTVVAARVKDGWPPLSRQNIESFHKLTAAEIKGPARLYRILSPNSRAMSDCWVSEKVFNDIQNSPDPRAAWRKYLGVWPDWNVNGQFVIYDVRHGESLKVWRGKASSQIKDALPDRYLEGGWEQTVFNVGRTDTRNDIMRYYKLKGNKRNILRDAISQPEFDSLSKAQKADYTGIREAVNHPNISGPFETGWGFIDFGGEGFLEKVGLPSLPGQITMLAK